MASVIGNNIVSSPTACKLHKCSYDDGFQASSREYGLEKTLQWRSGPRVNIKIIDRHCAYPSGDRGRRFRFRVLLFKFSDLDGETRPQQTNNPGFRRGGWHASLQSSVRNGPVQYISYSMFPTMAPREQYVNKYLEQCIAQAKAQWCKRFMGLLRCFITMLFVRFGTNY